MNRKTWKKTAALITVAAMTASMAGAVTVKADDEKVIKVGMMASVYPYAYIDDDDNLAGYDLDMLAALDEYMEDYTFECEDLQFAVLFESLETGAVDMLTGSINRTAEREEKYVTPTVDSGYNVCSLVVAEDNTDINGIDDMGGKTIAFDPTRAEYPTLTAWNEEHADNPMEIEDMNDPTQADTMKMVADGRKDAALIYRDSFDTIQAELSLPVKMLDEQTTKLAFTQLINPDMEGAEEFRDALDEALTALIEDGTLNEISEKWVGFAMFE